jgi:uncharacterized membrane protein
LYEGRTFRCGLFSAKISPLYGGSYGIPLYAINQIEAAMNSKWMKTVVNYILNGLVIMLPVFGTGYIIYHALKWLDGIVPALYYTTEELEEKGDSFTGWGIVILVVVLFVMGYLGSKFINEKLKGLFESLLDRVPGVNNLYHTISDVLGAFVGNKKKFDKPVLVKVSDDMDLEMIGFVTDTDLAELGNIQGKVSVYFPMSYSFSGHMLVVPLRNVKPLKGNPVDIMKYTISGGIVEFDPNEGAEKVSSSNKKPLGDK